MKKFLWMLFASLSLFVPYAMAEGAVTDLQQKQDFEQALAGDKPVVVDFYATWCGPCKMLAPVMMELAKDYEGQVTFIKVDVDQFRDLAGKYKIQGIPDVRVFSGGEEVEKLVGFMPKDQYQKVLDKLVS